MDDWNEIKRSLLTPGCLRQPDRDKVLCLSHWKTINSAPILVYPGHLRIWDLLPVWTLQKKEQEKGVYSREGRKSLSPLHAHLANSNHFRSQWGSLWDVRGLVTLHLTGPWFLLRECFLQETSSPRNVNSLRAETHLPHLTATEQGCRKHLLTEICL